MAGTPSVPHYGGYLRLDEMLGLQRPGRDLLHHDEMLFIVVHQVFELWFRLILYEMEAARDVLGRTGAAAGKPAVAEEDIPRVCEHLARVTEIQRVLIEQFRVMETMPPTHFLAFRDALIPASGFQSVQFREIEVLAGLNEETRGKMTTASFHDAYTDDERARIARRAGEMSISDALFDWLVRTPIDRAAPNFVAEYVAEFDRYQAEQRAAHQASPHLTQKEKDAAAAALEIASEACRKFLTGYDERTNRAHAAFVFIAVHREEPLLRWPYALIDRVVEFEEYLRLWRFRHARMVERMIGTRVGTGGSPGVGYLDHTASNYRIFGRLLEARSFLLDPRRLPPLADPKIFRFQFEG